MKTKIDRYTFSQFTKILGKNLKNKQPTDPNEIPPSHPDSPSWPTEDPSIKNPDRRDPPRDKPVCSLVALFEKN